MLLSGAQYNLLAFSNCPCFFAEQSFGLLITYPCFKLKFNLQYRTMLR